VNQFHFCETKDVGELFIGKPDELVLAFDTLAQAVMKWTPNSFGPSRHSVVFTGKKAWLIIKPMKNALDVKFYLKERSDSPLVKHIAKYPNKYAHHIRVARESEINKPLLDLLRQGYDYALGEQ